MVLSDNQLVDTLQIEVPEDSAAGLVVGADGRKLMITGHDNAFAKRIEADLGDMATDRAAALLRHGGWQLSPELGPRVVARAAGTTLLLDRLDVREPTVWRCICLRLTAINALWDNLCQPFRSTVESRDPA